MQTRWRPQVAVEYSLFLLFLSLPLVASASCGDIVAPGSGDEEIRQAITNCTDPFDATAETQAQYEVLLEGEPLVANQEFEVTEFPVRWSLSEQVGEERAALVNTRLYQKVEEDLVWRPEALSLEVGNVPAQTRTATLSLTATGTYYLVVETVMLIPPDAELPQLENPEQESVLSRALIDFFLPARAYASAPTIPWLDEANLPVYEGYPRYETVVLPFTVSTPPPPEPEPTGASSVLFLPGIQASRLYTEGLLGTENRLWEPNRNNDAKKLAMTEEGESINEIYTRDVLDEIFGTRNVYKSFLSMLADMKSEGKIIDYEPFAYDWRYDVFTVATEPVMYQDGEQKRLLDEIKRLAESSHTGKVTIVAHSNGGLVAKALMSEYQDNELAGLVEKVIFIGTPQIGTPKAIGSLLHGLDQGLAFEFLVTQGTARQTSRFMPGAYGLLPSKTYFEIAAEPFLTSDTSEIAQPVASYGDLHNYENFLGFLSDAQSTRNEVVNVSQPITLNRALLDEVVMNQARLDEWVAPQDVQVIEVAGTGLSTVNGFFYREFSCRENPACVLKPFLKPVPKFTLEGDKTVVLTSATAYEEDKLQFTVNLEGEAIFPKSHADITESEAVQTFLESALLYPQLTDTMVAEEFSSIRRTYTIIGVHSPVSIMVQNEAGEVVGIVDGEIKEEIAGSNHLDFAGSKYVIVPDDEEIGVLLTGQAAGRYSLTIESLTAEGQTLVQEIIGATSTSNMAASFDCLSGTCGEIEVDYEGDGVLDVRLDWQGGYEKLEQSEQVVSAKSNQLEPLSGNRSATRVGSRANPTGRVAGVTTTNIPQAELQRMWAQVMEIKDEIDRLKQAIQFN